jgi:hypothetical protein
MPMIKAMANPPRTDRNSCPPITAKVPALNTIPKVSIISENPSGNPPPPAKAALKRSSEIIYPTA